MRRTLKKDSMNKIRFHEVDYKKELQAEKERKHRNMKIYCLS